MGLLEGKVAIITGAGSEIGSATALRFAEEGARLLLNDAGGDCREGEKDASTAEEVAGAVASRGGRAVGTVHDVGTEAGAQQLVTRALDEFGRLDILVNVAWVGRSHALLETDRAVWDAVVPVQLRETFLCMRAAAAYFVAHGAGRIVNTVGRAGLIGDAKRVSAAAVQAGVYGLTRAAAIELQRFGVMVNAVAPIVRTQVSDDGPALAEHESLTLDQVVPVALFLASDLSGASSGCVLAVAGGRLSTYRMVESRGRYKETKAGAWLPEEILEHWESIAKI